MGREEAPAIVAIVDIEPALGRLVGIPAAARIGHEPVLPVLDVAAGPWNPERPPAALALAVLSGLLQTTHELFGPGDRFDPWSSEERWTACTDVRIVVLGRELAAQLDAWPALAGEIAGRRRPAFLLPMADDGDQQLLTLLWRIAQRWGTSTGELLVLPATIDAAVLAALSGRSAARVSEALGRLTTDGPLEISAGQPWRLHGRDDLRARVAHGLACARQTGDTFVAISTTRHDGAAEAVRVRSAQARASDAGARAGGTSGGRWDGSITGRVSGLERCNT